ncbi:hypothetical protein ECG_04570 [Echinococcus granulosus]|uniref:Expressed protein n=1 Tax=Echinococcus granulosus TaxID=6210 RepID=A0A068WFC9_ECHGR|nr:hypothetical protein ECG_04570 [Echinococcus granulosus]CDS17142.1 expressed protein [Echinococcus granulosus]
MTLEERRGATYQAREEGKRLHSFERGFSDSIGEYIYRTVGEGCTCHIVATNLQIHSVSSGGTHKRGREQC